MTQRFSHVIATHLILIRENKILLARRFNTGWSDGQYSVPAGHLDGKETVLQAMAREAKEEAGVDIDEKDMAVVHVMNRKATDHERIDFFVAAKKWRGEPHIAEPNKCDDMRWVSLNELPDNTVPYIRQAIGAIGDKIFYSEFGW
jgi:8-oxo-dGTP diphosphatase